MVKVILTRQCDIYLIATQRLTNALILYGYWAFSILAMSLLHQLNYRLLHLPILVGQWGAEAQSRPLLPPIRRMGINDHVRVDNMPVPHRSRMLPIPCPSPCLHHHHHHSPCPPPQLLHLPPPFTTPPRLHPPLRVQPPRIPNLARIGLKSFSQISRRGYG